MILRLLVHARQQLRTAPGRRRLGLAGQVAILEPLDSPRQLVLPRLDRRFQPAGTTTCASAERAECSARSATGSIVMNWLLARAACKQGSRTAVGPLERVLKLLQRGLLLREQLEAILLAHRRLAEFG